MQFARLPRVRLAHLPTPLEEAPRLARALGGPRIFVKRDDATGLALGGNKVRKLEFILADALRAGADTILTTGGAQSNHCRMTVAACRRLGLDVHLVLDGGRPAEVTGSLLADSLMGAAVEFLETDDEDEVAAHLEARREALAARGRRPYVVPLGGSVPLGAVGFALGVLEVLEQAAAMDVAFDRIVVASGSGGTQAGLELGARALRTGARVEGIAISANALRRGPRVAELATAGAELLGVDLEVRPEDVAILGGYVGPGYGVLTPAAADAIRLVARTEGLLLDPVYTGKAMAGLVDRIRSGAIGRDETVLFWHTGGVPALFAYAGHFREEWWP